MKFKKMRPDAYMPLFIGDWLKDTGHLDATCQGAYFLLIMQHWGKPGIPCDDDSLMMISKVRVSDWARVKGTIKHFFTEANGLWTNSCCVNTYASIDKSYKDAVKRAENARANNPDNNPKHRH
jgi:uncharacterized protein YdaU (DUF1376 family)